MAGRNQIGSSVDHESAVGPDPLHKAARDRGTAAELEWHSAVIDRLDREVPDPATAWVDVELARLVASLRISAGQHAEPSDLPLHEGCERLQAILLSRRIAHELAWPVEGATPEALWEHRFHLTRLRTQATATDAASAQDAFHSQLARERADWIDKLDRRREELTLAAAEHMASFSLCDRVAPAEPHRPARGSTKSGETMAFLEDMSLGRAVDRLKLIGDDLARLSEACLEWPRAEQSRHAVLDFPEEIYLPSLSPIPGAASSRPMDEAGHRQTAAADLEGSGQTEARDHGRACPAAIASPRAWFSPRRCPGRARLAGETAHAADGEDLSGARFVAILENTVLVLIVVLFGLTRSRPRSVLERASVRGLSAAQHVFFAWADLAVCSVFLFEFTLKLAFAPHRTTYLLRHVLIDLVASLPFGFVAHQIALERMGDALGAPDGLGSAWWGPARIARVARSFRFLRVVLPVVRLARVGLVLLRLLDRLVRRMGKLLNRNIVLFEPLHTQKPESSERHRLIALRSELEHARSSAVARLDRDQARRLSERVLSDLERRVDSLPDPVLADPAPETTSREIPVEAVVEPP